jgi:membrane protease YdiL (CAAX protease family)
VYYNRKRFHSTRGYLSPNAFEAKKVVWVSVKSGQDQHLGVFKMHTNIKKIIVFAALLELIYLSLSFALAQQYGQWSYEGEIIRTALRIISILFYAYIYQHYFYKPTDHFETKNILTPQLITSLVLFLLFAIVYTNAEHETGKWQLVFAISGITAGLREELFYRGIVQQTLQLQFNPKIALTVATLLFTLSHVQYLYYSQFNGLMLIACAGIIFGSVFIYTGSIVFTACIHALYDVLISVNIVPFRLGNAFQLPLLALIVLAFLLILNKKFHGSHQADEVRDVDTDNLSMG